MMIIRNLFAIALLATIGLSSCDREDEFECPGELQASWRANGTYEESYVGFYFHTATLLNLTFSACVDSDNDKVLSIAYIPYPPTEGTFDLVSGPGLDPTAQGLYDADVEGNFWTDAVHTGTVTLTDVDTVAQRISGTFQFTAVNVDNASETIQITEGQIYNIQY